VIRGDYVLGYCESVYISFYMRVRNKWSESQGETRTEVKRYSDESQCVHVEYTQTPFVPCLSHKKQEWLG
jgi:hypothetical protein